MKLHQNYIKNLGNKINHSVRNMFWVLVHWVAIGFEIKIRCRRDHRYIQKLKYPVHSYIARELHFLVIS